LLGGEGEFGAVRKSLEAYWVSGQKKGCGAGRLMWKEIPNMPPPMPVKGPLCVERKSSTAAACTEGLLNIPELVVTFVSWLVKIMTWSFSIHQKPLSKKCGSEQTSKFCPTPERSDITEMPCFFRAFAGPTPESMRRCGECIYLVRHSTRLI